MLRCLNNREWQIWLAERPVRISLSQDLVQFGRPFSHPFLVLKNSYNEVAAEIHGTWPMTGLKKRPGFLIDRFTGAQQSEKLNKTLSVLTKPVYPHAVISHYNGERQFHRSANSQLIESGAEEKVCRKWERLASEFSCLNAEKRPYYRYATPGSGFANCQIMLSTALQRAAVFESVPDLKFAQTGWTVPSKPAITMAL